jgi:hypothetical protein
MAHFLFLIILFIKILFVVGLILIKILIASEACPQFSSDFKIRNQYAGIAASNKQNGISIGPMVGRNFD